MQKSSFPDTSLASISFNVVVKITLRRLVLLQRNRNPPAVQVVAGTLGQPPHILEPLTICSRLLRVVHKGDRLLILNEFLPPPVKLFPFLLVEFKADLLEEVIGLG